VRTTLREGIRTARELRIANHALTEQLSHTIRVLTERCELLTNQRLQEVTIAEYAGPADSGSMEIKALPDLLPTTRPLRPERIA
jgi:hypothetical protein